jgi:hypothetical protein
MKLTKKLLILINLCLFGGLVLFVALSQIAIAQDLKCTFATMMHMYCPGCGGTRAVYALLHFDIVSAIRYNILVPYMLVLYFYYNISAIIFIKRGGDEFWTKKRFIPIYVFVAIMLLNFVLRNILLWGFGIDLIGDILGHRP